VKIPTCEHKDRPVKSLGLCNSCYVKQHKEKNPEYAKVSNDRAKNWRHLNPERQKYNYLKRKEREKGCPIVFMKKRNGLLKRKYGITNEIYQKMYDEQNGCCKLCKIKEGKRKLHTDHCHTTGKVRGLLCYQCNWYLGKIDKDLSIINRIKQYLELI